MEWVVGGLGCRCALPKKAGGEKGEREVQGRGLEFYACEGESGRSVISVLSIVVINAKIFRGRQWDSEEGPCGCQSD